MIAERSPSVNRPFGVARACRLLQRSRSGVYWARSRPDRASIPAHKRGPKTTYSDQELTEKIRGVLAATPFAGGGPRKVWVRLRQVSVMSLQRRVLRLMREANLLSPTRARRVLGPRVHEGTITTSKPNERWGTDATSVWTDDEGVVTVFAAIDHCTAECVGSHAAKQTTRFEALEPVRQGVREHVGAYAANCASGLELRHDHGSQYMSDHFQSEIAFLGIRSSPDFVRAPEGNGCIERFFRTLKEQLLWTRRIQNAEDVRLAVAAWVRLYNEQWPIERHGHRASAANRRELLAIKVPA